MDLSKRKVESKLKQWVAIQHPARREHAEGLVGRVLVYDTNKVSLPITEVDPKSHRVLTKAGQVFELDIPFKLLGIDTEKLVKEAGFPPLKFIGKHGWDFASHYVSSMVSK
jgi:hypothetical protein